MRKQKIDPRARILEELKKEIDRLQQCLETANSNFDNVSDPDLIDSYIYELTALASRYKYLLRQVRKCESESAALNQGNKIPRTKFPVA